VATAANAFNPQIGVVLSGTYSNLSQDPDDYRLQGFMPGGDETGPGSRSFSLGESEITLSANIDPDFYGQITLSVEADDSIGVEEAFVRTTSLPDGLIATGGRFFSNIGYLNTQHAHNWDFTDTPLVYQALFGGQYSTEGARLSWLAPLDQFVELGVELGNGYSFPGNDVDKNGVNATTFFASTGGDIGDSGSWKALLSYLHTHATQRDYDDIDSTGANVTNAFSGDSDTWGAGIVYKWAPNGNMLDTNLTLQGEYFYRNDDGSLMYDVFNQSGGPAWGPYHAAQSGWYFQSVYQFMPRWRVGARYDQLYADTRNISPALNSADFSLLDGYNPNRSTLMIDFSPSEFSRFRLQFANDNSQPDHTDHQIFLQYIMSLGAHGTHPF
jgi:hypothetical protein